MYNWERERERDIHKIFTYAYITNNIYKKTRYIYEVGKDANLNQKEKIVKYL